MAKLFIKKGAKFSKEDYLRLTRSIEKEKQDKEKAFAKSFERTGFELGRSASGFGQVGVRPQEPFSREQEALNSMFGGGEKIWGTVGEPVQINNDLNPRQRGDRGTAELFGF